MNAFYSRGLSSALAGLVFVIIFSGQDAKAGVITTNPALPPDVGGYLSQFHATFSDGTNKYDLNNIIHTGFTNVTRQNSGQDEIEDFGSTLFADLTATDIATNTSWFMGPIELTGPVQTVVLGKVGQTTGTFATEILSMSLSGNVGGNPIIIRESPAQSSNGRNNHY